jgi:hypothetical protein
MIQYLIFFLLFPLFTFAQTYNGPESVEFNSISGNYFISNASQGSIVEWDGTGLTIFANNISAGPHGLELVDEILYACSGGSIKGYHLISGDQVLNKNLGGTFLNGITHRGKDLYITDFTSKRLYKYDTENQDSLYVAPILCTFPKTPNGVYYDEINDRLLVVCWGANAPIYEVNISTGEILVATPTSLGNLDGISMDICGNIFVSAWSTNAIHMFNLDLSSNQQVASGLNSPADIFYNQENHILAIPNSGNNTVDFLELDFCDNLTLSDHSKEVKRKKTIDMMGRSLPFDAKGLRLDVYEDGTVVKTFTPFEN